MMSDVNSFDFRTGSHAYAEGEVWAEYDGPSLKGYYKNIGGKRVEATPQEYKKAKGWHPRTWDANYQEKIDSADIGTTLLDI